MCTISTQVTKMIARNGEREIIPSSLEEKQQFIVEGKRPEFQDDSILCIKFLDAIETDEFVGESSWFVNPVYAERFHNSIATIFEEGEVCNYESAFLGGSFDDKSAMEFASVFGYSPYDAYGPKLASEFLPEVLLLQEEHPGVGVLEEYQDFHSELLKYGLSTATFTLKLMLFCRYLKCESFHEKIEVVPKFIQAID